jgi:hypothetical protein
MKKLLLFFTLISLQSCNSIFFQPDRIRYFNPESENIEYRDIFIPGYDGKKIHMWIFPAAGEARGTIVQFHGNAENMSSHFASLFWVTRKNYNFITFDYRGYGESEGKIDDIAIRKDAVLVAQYIKKLGKDLLGEKLIFHGQSLGGIILQRALIDMDQKFLPDAAVLESTFHSYREIAFKQLSRQWFTALLIPVAFFLISDYNAPAGQMNKLPKIPYLIVHSHSDEIVPFPMGKKLFELIHSPKSFIELRGERHMGFFLTEDNRKKYMDFLNNL